MYLTRCSVACLLTLACTTVIFMVGFLTDYMIYVGQFEHFGLFNSILEDEEWWQVTQGLACTGFICLACAVGIYLIGICCENCSRKAVLLIQCVMLLGAALATGLAVIIFGVNLPDAYVIRSGTIGMDFSYYLLAVSTFGFLLAALFAFCDAVKE